ncbi:glycosyltransferase [Sphingomonas sanguinis]|uniref:glycosyltransferase family 2 protein n=1 Tax=Sphingomonas sp. LC-1 TaxID=3110957 RepID=UPI0021BADC47|nr:glycosyltransferase [Sphingomonas sp. LC-1]MCT8000783.1 glycosyltransferase [Sphingomonas sp. LC-1]
MRSPRISVAFSAHDNAAYLTEALDSSLAQSFGDFELAIVEGRSTDGSSAIIERYALLDRGIRVIRQAKSRWIASLNRITQVGRGDHSALMETLALRYPLCHSAVMMRRVLLRSWATRISRCHRLARTEGMADRETGR